MNSSFLSGARRYSPAFWVMCLALVAAFLMGGGARADIRSLVVLRPLSALILAYGLSGLRWQQVRAHGFLFGMAAAIVALVLFQLVPLPPSIWSALPGREIVVEIDRASALGAVWRPISMVPPGTWNAFYALLLPLAVLALGARLSLGELSGLLSLLICIGLLSGLLALLQLGGAKDGPLYLYEVTNNGAAVGLFANRNHEAVFLASLLPMLAGFASAGRPSSIDARLRSALALVAGMFLIPLLLVTGSRAGFIAGSIALLSLPFIYRLPRGREKRARHVEVWLLPVGAIVAVVGGLFLLTVLLGRAEAFDRLAKGLSDKELRYQAWVPLLDMIWRYFPIGTGFGSFRELFLIDEPHGLLALTQFFHAHNDWLELALTGGLPALLLVGLAVAAFFRKVIKLLQSSRDNCAGRELASTGGGFY